MSVLTTKPQFLYPYSRQFPFDEVAEKIVRAIEKRNWNVPGMSIKFDTYGSGEAKFQMIRSIIGDNFKLYFGRIQGILNSKWNDVAAISSVCIPRQILEVYGDGSGPSYYLYVGNNWDYDKEWFMNSTKVNSKLNNEPRRYLKYKRNFSNKRTKELIADNDLGREYSPEGNEPIHISIDQKFNEFTLWLEEFVLKYILSFPEANTIQPPVPLEELIPYEGPWHIMYSVCNGRALDRIEKGKKNPCDLPLEDRHAYIGMGHRLVPLYVPCNGKFPKIAYEGFIWCDVNPKSKPLQNTELVYEVNSAMAKGSIFNEYYIVAINLKYANQVYVADNSKYEETRQQLFEAIAPREILTDDELYKALASRGATIVPITEYKGDYKEPIVLIKRALEFEEIEQIFH